LCVPFATVICLLRVLGKRIVGLNCVFELVLVQRPLGSSPATYRRGRSLTTE
jgi:hypothetical protein